MSDPGNQGNIDVGGSVSGRVVIMGHGNRVELHENGSAEVSRQLLLLGGQLSEVLRRLGALPEIAPGVSQPPPPASGAPADSPGDRPSQFFNLGKAAVPDLPASTVEEARRSAVAVDGLLRQLDQHLDPQAKGVSEIQFGQTRLNVIDLLVQQGNLALWRFRQAYARLFGQQMTAMLRALLDWPMPPEIQSLVAQARTDSDVLRSMALYETMGAQRPDLVAAADDMLSRGLWRQVIDGWVAQQAIPEELAQYLRTSVAAVGEPYRPDDVRAAHVEAEARFNEALRRQPNHPAALVNLAQLQAESATFIYIESGTPDRPRLRRAHVLYRQAIDLLSQRSDRESQVALGKCLLYAGTALPEDADLAAVPWAALAAQLRRATYSQPVQKMIRWDVLQRNLATHDPAFIQVGMVQQARDRFLATGEALLAEQCSRNLQGLEQMRSSIPWMTQQMQAIRPVVGTWSFVARNLFAVLQGMLVFDSDGNFRWQADVQGMAPQRITLLARYQAVNNFIQVQGQRWNQVPHMLPASAPFMDQIIVQGTNGTQLTLLSQQEGLQIQCQRL